MLQVYRPAREIEEILGGSPVTGVRLVDGKVQTYIEYNGQPSMFTEDPEQVFGAIRVTGATLTGPSSATAACTTRWRRWNRLTCLLTSLLRIG